MICDECGRETDTLYHYPDGDLCMCCHNDRMVWPVLFAIVVGVAVIGVSIYAVVDMASRG